MLPVSMIDGGFFFDFRRVGGGRQDSAQLDRIRTRFPKVFRRFRKAASEVKNIIIIIYIVIVVRVRRRDFPPSFLRSRERPSYYYYRS